MLRGFRPVRVSTLRDRMRVYVFLESSMDAVRIRIAVHLEMYVFPVSDDAYLYYGDTISVIVVSTEKRSDQEA